MHKENIKKLKKYLLFISVLFIVLTSAHLFYIYLQEEAKETPIKWGVISEWIYWDVSKYKLNPLMFWKNPKEDYIMSFLYRWLLTYNTETKNINSDLAKCDYSDLLKIKCSLNDDLKWSDWTEITPLDVISTYKIIKDKKEKLNLKEYLYLKNTEIFLDSEKNIIFKYNKNDWDINFIPVVLFQPIVPKTILDKIWTQELFWKFDYANWIFSGEYVYDNLIEEESWITKLKLKKNIYYNWKKSYISKYNFKFSLDIPKLIKNVNIFDNKDWLINKTSRFEEYEYNLPTFLSLFINADKINDVELRNFILSSINRDNIINLLDKKKKIISVENPFFIEWYNLDKNIKAMNLSLKLKKKWFIKKSEILENLLLKDKKEENLLEWKKDDKKISEDKKLKYIVSNDINKKYNFISEELIINWNLNWEKPMEVIVEHNDRKIKLNSYKNSWGKNFVFGLKSNFNTLVPGKNTYKIYFNNASNDYKLKEEFIVYYSKDPKKLKEFKNNYLNSTELKQEKEKENLEKSEQLKKIENLDDKYFYDKNLKAFSLKMYYIKSEDNFTVAEAIVSALKEKWIKVEVNPIKLIELKKKNFKWEKDYDMILAPIDLWYFKFNISGYFHSGYANKWFNLSKIRAPELDAEFLELNKEFLTQKEKLKKQFKILEILKEKQVVKTLYSVKNTKFVDKTIKNYKNYKEVPNYLYTKFWLNDTYILSKKEINFDKKSVFWYITFLKNIFLWNYK